MDGPPASSARIGIAAPTLLVLRNAGRLEVGVEPLLQGVVDRHLMAAAAFLVQADPPALADRIVVLDPHGRGGARAKL
jgi:hypothetical protein